MFVDCVNKIGDGERELFIVEGISAAKAATIARDPLTQAILAPVLLEPVNKSRIIFR